MNWNKVWIILCEVVLALCLILLLLGFLLNNNIVIQIALIFAIGTFLFTLCIVITDIRNRK